MTRLIKPRPWLGVITALAMVTALLAGCGGSSTSHNNSSSATTKAPNAGTPQHGGTLTILEQDGAIGSWPQGLDPAHNSLSGEDEPMEEAAFGELFAEDAKGNVIPDLATGYKFLDGGMTVDIFLRHGVTFQDGTPFNAAAVKWNIDRDLDPANACICDSNFPIASITTQGDYTVVLHMKEVYAPIITSFTLVASPNWPVSPTAFQKMGEKAFALKPVGAGPFEIVSDQVNTELVLQRNPNYWQKGRPYLDKLIFKTVGTPESEYEALQAGQAQAMQQISTLSVIQTAQKNPNLRVVKTDAAGMLALQLNTTTAPFNNIKAREAIYYAIDQKALSQVLTGGAGSVAQSGDGPASLFPIPTVPGYRTYDLAKAKSLVKELGGLTFSMIGTNGSVQQLLTALQSEFAAAGIKTSITVDNLAQEVKAFETNSWQAIPGGGGGLDPQLGAGGLAWRAYSTGPFTGIHDKTLDGMINQGVATLSHSGRMAVYQKLYKYLSDNAYLPFLYGNPLYNISSPKTHGLGLDAPMADNYSMDFPNLWLSK